MEARSEIFVICRVANVPCWEESVESLFARTVFTVVCLRLFLVPAAGDVSVVGMILVALSAIEVAFSAIEEVLVVVDEVLVVVDEVVVQEMEEVEAVSSSIIMGRLDGVVVGEGVSDRSDGGDGSEERICLFPRACCYSRRRAPQTGTTASRDAVSWFWNTDVPAPLHGDI